MLAIIGSTRVAGASLSGRSATELNRASDSQHVILRQQQEVLFERQMSRDPVNAMITEVTRSIAVAG